MTEQKPDTLQDSANYLPNTILESQEGYIQAVPIEHGRLLSQSGAPRHLNEFPSPGSKEVEGGLPAALQYPGKRPEGSFSLSDSQVALGRLLESVPVQASLSLEEGLAFYVNVRGGDGKELVWNIDDLLKNAEAAKLEDRIPVITFGSNANPGQLVQKMMDLEGADKNVVPTLKAHVKGVAPAYVARIGINGYTFTDLVPTTDPEAKTEVYINFLSRPQLEAVNATEGAYSLCELPDVQIDTADGEGIKMPAYLYVGREDSKAADLLTDQNGKLIRLSELAVEGKGVDQEFSAMSQTEVQKYIGAIAKKSVAAKLGISPDVLSGDFDLVELNRNRDERLRAFKDGLTLEDKKRLGGVLTQNVIQQSIKESGKTVAGMNVRTLIPPENRDKTLDEVKTFAELRQKTIAATPKT